MLVGIDDINFYVPNLYLSLDVLARHRGENPEKYRKGLGQYCMSLAPLDEDIVTMGANAAHALIKNRDTTKIKSLFFATESAIDQSKSAGIYVHRLLGLHENIRVIELKQACYSATVALQMACALVARDPDQEVLLIAADIARYGLETPGEATQGCGAVAMHITANPRLLALHPEYGCYCEDVMDFWRPNYLEHALVNGKYSTQVYLKALRHSWKNYQACGGEPYTSLSWFCYHLPFSKMGEKAHRKLALTNSVSLSDQHIGDTLYSSLLYNQYIGNTYSASLYISLLSLLENEDGNLAGQHVGLFSYGSGCSSEFFSATIQEGYRSLNRKNLHLAMLENREALDYEAYVELYNYRWPIKGEECVFKRQTAGKYRLNAIKNHQRIYVSSDPLE